MTVPVPVEEMVEVVVVDGWGVLVIVMWSVCFVRGFVRVRTN